MPVANQAKPKNDGELLAAISEIRRRKPRWGVRRTHRQLRRRGLAVNRKRVERIGASTVWRCRSAGAGARCEPVPACRSPLPTATTSGPTT